MDEFALAAMKDHRSSRRHPHLSSTAIATTETSIELVECRLERNSDGERTTAPSVLGNAQGARPICVDRSGSGKEPDGTRS
jgi:hypothetical protein